MRNLMYILFFAVLITFSSCKQHDLETEENLLGGFYKIETISADKLVDLNGDSQRSHDLRSEINEYFNEHEYDLEIRPNDTNANTSNLISFYFPEPYLSFEYPSNPNGFVEYARTGVGSSYEFKDNQFFLTETKNEFVTIDQIELLVSGKIRSMISKDYYDFEIQKWTNLNIEILYSKKE